jgi:hypothetical protein
MFLRAICETHRPIIISGPRSPRYVLYGDGFVYYVNINAVNALYTTDPSAFDDPGDDVPKNIEISQGLCGVLNGLSGIHGLDSIFP